MQNSATISGEIITLKFYATLKRNMLKVYVLSHSDFTGGYGISPYRLLGLLDLSIQDSITTGRVYPAQRTKLLLNFVVIYNFGYILFKKNLFVKRLINKLYLYSLKIHNRYTFYENNTHKTR